MGTKHDILTEEEFLGVNLREIFVKVLEDYASRANTAPCDIRVLDLGCGRGTTVLKLLNMGFDAFGIDIDPEPILNGSPLFLSQGFDPNERLLPVGPAEQFPFSAGCFDVVMSDQVLEHVSDLDFVANEVSRVTKQAGVGVHFFPARWITVEPHLFVPFVHWLPKNRLRYVLLKIMYKKLPQWKELESKTVHERLTTFYDYSIQNTFYRSLAEIIKTFKKSGLEPTLANTKGPLWFSRLLPNSYLMWHYKTFHNVALCTERR